MDRNRFRGTASFQPQVRPTTPPQPQVLEPTPTVAVPITVVTPPEPVRSQAAPTAVTPVAPVKEVTINIAMPKLGAPRLSEGQKVLIRRLSARARRTRVRIPAWFIRLVVNKVSAAVAVVAVVVGCGMFGYSTFFDPSKAPATITTVEGTAAGEAVSRAAPSFTPVVPKSRPDLATPKEGVSMYDGTRDVYSYAETFQGTRFTVSQQPLPAGKGSLDETVAMVAGDIGAKEKLTLGNGTKAYIKTEKSGAQTIVFGTRSVLVFIQSGFKHSAADWAIYLGTLE
jgi:hypothetical protein